MEERKKEMEEKIKLLGDKIEEFESKIRDMDIHSKFADLPQDKIKQLTVNGQVITPTKKIVNKETVEEVKGQRNATIPKTITLNGISFSQNEKYMHQFATADESGRVILWNSKKAAQITEETTAAALNSCAFEPRDGKLIGCGGTDSKVYVFKINPKQEKNEQASLMGKLCELAGHQGPVNSLGFLNGQYVVSGSNDASMILWDLQKPDLPLVKYNEHDSEIQSVDVFNLDGNMVVTGSTDKSARVWDIRMKKACIRFFNKVKSGVGCVKFMLDSVHTIATGCDDSAIKIYDLRAMGKVAKLKEEHSFEAVSSLAFSRSGRVLFSSYRRNTINVWDVLTEKLLDQQHGEHKDVIRSLALSYDGSTLVSAGKDGIIQLWS